MSNSPEILYNVLPNIDAHINRYSDGRFAAYELYPHSGYAILDPAGEKVFGVPYYSYGGMSITEENYNWAENSGGFEAVLISDLPPETIIFGDEPNRENM